MAPHYLLLLLLPLLAAPARSEEVPDRYAVRHAPQGAGGASAAAKEYLDPTFPLPQPPPAAPSCTVPVLSYSFGDTYGAAPAKASYAPPAGCPAPWSLVVLTFSASCAGDQYDRVAAVWLDGAELLRTTTAEPTAEGVRWTVRKDVTRYSALLRSPPGGVLSVMLENVVNDKYTGVYSVNVSLEFHGTLPYLSDAAASSSPSGVASNDPEAPMLPESYFQPADLIIPISDVTGNGKSGFWFRIQNASDSRSKFVTIPSSSYRAVLEVFVSPHSNDVYWYSNPPDIYIKENNLTTRRGNAAYREVVVSVDHRFVGSFVPFPVIYTGGINPLFWQPVAALGAFDLPTYDVELTPFLGLLVDSNAHEIGLSVVDGIAEWLVDANLHVWLDPSTSDVHAALGPYQTPRLKISRHYSTRLLEGKFKIKAKRKSSFSGWVKSSFGNFTTEVETELKATSLVEFTNDGKNKTVSLEAKQETKTQFRADTRKVIGKVEREAKYPLSLFTETEDGENGTSVVTVSLSHGLNVEKEIETKAFENKEKLADEQTAEGWMVVMDHDVVNGSVTTTQSYRFSDEEREYERMIDVMDGAVLSDNVTESFSALAGIAAL
ncbi:hypothetical protein E2562_002170 [Oryza meyeriana var. granulata]|uniref:Peptide N-acetyl-beta-D-glucosaminyl asparaginase amidase A N-terminal domain-containing protein n=1 Tax=Oryza meyeriana var. granulata TaxID=110450 RepID=A0A6G1EG54_9ORYZ|nr:hypothetical protein E2562_002170 [Oryza meyeriana var. granulata]